MSQSKSSWGTGFIPASSGAAPGHGSGFRLEGTIPASTGLLPNWSAPPRHPRFIPASAGAAEPAAWPSELNEVHPRVRGGLGLIGLIQRLAHGPSPRPRGLRLSP